MEINVERKNLASIAATSHMRKTKAIISMNRPLDSDFYESESGIGSLAYSMDRMKHFAVDMIVIVLLYFTITILLIDYRASLKNNYLLLLALVQFSYYTVLESLTGRTLGHLLNKSEVVQTDGSKPRIYQVLIRSIVRFVPFEFVPIFTPYNQCLHDMISKTWVVRMKKNANNL